MARGRLFVRTKTILLYLFSIFLFVICVFSFWCDFRWECTIVSMGLSVIPSSLLPQYPAEIRGPGTYRTVHLHLHNQRFVIGCHSFVYFFLILVQYITFICTLLHQKPSPFAILHFHIAFQFSRKNLLECRIELKPASQQADAQPFKLRRNPH